MQGMECFTISSLEKVFDNIRPTLYENENSCFKNETFSFQVAYFSRDSESFLESYTYQVISDISDYIYVRPIKSSPCTKPVGISHDDYFLVDKPCLVPDILANETTFYVRYQQWGALWVTVQGVLPKGVHSITIKINSGKKIIASSIYKLNVLDETLPKCEIDYANWLHYDSLARYYNIQVWSKEFNEIMWNYVDNMVSHNVNTLLVPLFTPPINIAVGGERDTVQLIDVAYINKKWEFDFGRLETFMTNARKHGIQKFEMSHLYTQWGALHPPKIMAKYNGEHKQVFGWNDDSLGPEYVMFIRLFLTKLTDFLKEKNYLSDCCFFHISDEPNASHIDRYLQIREIVKPVLKDYIIMDALSDYEFYKRGAVDIPVVSTDKAQDFFDVENYWVYYCCGQEKDFLSNRFISMPLQRTRILGFQLYITKAKGFLQWGYNYYNSALSESYINPYFVTDACGSFHSGDSFIVYPDKNGAPLDSIRHEVMKDAFQDYCALRLLESKIGRQNVVDFLMQNGLDYSYSHYPLSAVWHSSLRRKINELIIQSCVGD